jgi:RimJ/RimL family protein N-acetyltransferase
MRGNLCDLHVRLHEGGEIGPYTMAIMSQDTTRFMLTGSHPMRWIDTKAVWDRERAAGDVLFSIWMDGPSAGGCDHSMVGKCYECSRKFIGICGLHGLRDIYHSAELRILIFDKDAIGKGIGTEACRMLVEYGFNRLNLHRIWLGVNADNKLAVNCYKKVGFKQEGRQREAIFYHGKYADVIQMGVLRSEW